MTDKIEVTIEGNHSGGVVSEISYQNLAFREGIETMFPLRDDEKIVCIDFKDNSVVAYFEYIT